MPLSYRQVKDIYDELADAGVVTQSLPEWAAAKNQSLGSNAFSAGLEDNWIKRSSVGIDRLLEATGIPDVLADLGEGVGDWVGNPEAGRAIGQGSLRGLLNFVPVFRAGTALRGLLGTAGLAGSDAYTQTGSPGAGVFAGALSAAMPGIGGLAERATLRALGGETLKGRVLTEAGASALKAGGTIGADGVTALNTVLPRTIAQGIGGQVGANVGAGLAGEAGSMLEAALTPDDPENPRSQYHFSPTEALLNLTLGQIPFAGLYATKGGKASLGGKTSREYSAKIKADFEVAERAIAQRDALEASKNVPLISQIPNIETQPTPTQVGQFNAHIEALRKQQRDALAEATPESMARARQLQIEEDQMRAVTNIVDLDGVAGVRMTEATPRMTLPGTVHFERPETNYRIIKTPDGKLFGYSTVGEPPPIPSQQFPGHMDFSLPDGFWSQVQDNKAKVQEDPNQLPLEPGQETDPSVHFDHVAALAEADAELTAAKLPVEFQSALVKLNGVRQAFGIPPLSDRLIAKRQKAFNLDYQKAAQAEAKKTARLISSVQKAKQTEADNIARGVARTEGVPEVETSGRQKGKEGGDKPVIKLPKESDSSLPIYDILDEVITGEVYAKDADQSFSAWQKQTKVNDKTSIPKERERFKIYWKLRSLGDISPGELTKGDLEVLNDAFKEETLDAQSLADLVDFHERDHVLNWMDAIEAKLEQIGGRQSAARIQDKNHGKWVIKGLDNKHEFVVTAPNPADKEAKYGYRGEKYRVTHFKDGQAISHGFANDLGEIQGRIRGFMKEEGIRPQYDLFAEPLFDGSMADVRAEFEGVNRIQDISAGDGFIWSLEPYDQEANRIGRHTGLPKSGIVPEAQFQLIAGKGKPLNKVELEFAKLIAPEAFGEGTVDLKKLYAKLEMAKEVVSKVTYGMEGKENPVKLEADQLHHEFYETLTVAERRLLEDIDPWITPELTDIQRGDAREKLRSEYNWRDADFQKADRIIELSKQLRDDPSLRDSGPRATSYYRQISPFDTKKYPVVRIDVTLPETRLDQLSKPPWDLTPEERKEYTELMNKGPLWSPDNLHENLPNTLGWAMVQFVPHPVTGETVMFVGEQQSRWGQARQKELGRWKVEQNEDGTWSLKLGENTVPDKFPSREAALKNRDLRMKAFGSEAPDHPLLPIQHLLVLKAAIQEARKRGVGKIVLSDGESAMMTEGHDKAANPALTRNKENEQKVKNLLFDISQTKGLTLPFDVETRRAELKEWLGGNDNIRWSQDDLREFTSRGIQLDQKVSQEGGMRLHYDTTLPNALSKLTGSKGEKVEMGVHKNAERKGVASGADQTAHYNELRAQGISHPQALSLSESGRPGSPVFRNPDGTPKSSVTGTSYDISKFPADQQFTLADPARAPYVPKTEGERLVVEQLHLDKGAAGGLQHVIETTEPGSWYNTLARDLVKGFPELLSRMKAQLVDGEGPSSAFVDQFRRLGGITYRSDVLSASPEARAQIVLHEVVHQISLAELQNPTKQGIVSDLEGLRKRLIETLSPQMRAKLKAAEDTQFLQRWGRGEADFSELHENNNLAQIIYGLLNTQELVTAGLTGPSMRNYMMSVRGKNGGLWQKFTGFVRSLVGLRPEVLPGTAFAEFLGYTDALTTQGEYVAKFQNFAERFLENKGYDSLAAVEHSRRALSLVVDSSFQGLSPLVINDYLGRNTGPLSPKFARAQKDLVDLINERGDRYNNLAQVMGEIGLEPTKIGLDRMVQDGLSGDIPLDAFEILPDEAVLYITEKLQNMRDVVEVMKAASDPGNKGLVNLADPASIHGPAKETLEQINRVMEVHRKFQESLAIIESIQGIEPGNFFARAQQPDYFGDTGAAAAFFKDRLDDGKTTVKSFFKRLGWFLKPTGQYEDPVLKEGFAFGYQMISNARKWAMDAFKHFAMDMPKSIKDTVFTHDANVQAAKDLSNPKLQRAADRWIYWNQENGKATGKTEIVPNTDPRIAKELSHLTPAERAKVAEYVVKQELSNREMNLKELTAMEQIAGLHGAKLLNKFTGLKHTENMAISNEVLKAVRLDWSDPQQAAVGQQMLAQVQAKIQPELVNDLLQMHRAQAGVLKTMKEFYDAHPAWASAQRTGKYIVKFKNAKGQIETHGADSRKHADQLAGGHNKVLEFTERRKQGDEDVPHFGSDYQEIFERLQVHENEMIRIMELRGMDPEDIAVLRKLGPSTQFARETQGQGLSVPTAPARGLTRGAENLPWLSNHLSDLHRRSTYWSRRLFREQMDAYIAQADIPDEVKKDLKTHRDNILMADPESIQNLNAFTRVWFMGFNSANVIINAFQPFTTHVAELTALTGKPLDSYRRTLSALKEIGGWKWGKRDWSDPEIAKLMQRALDDGEVGLSAYDDQAAAQEAATLNLKDAMDGNRPKTLGQRMAKAGGMYSKAAMWLFTHGEQVNNRAALIASFKLFREQGLSFDQAYTKAVDFNHKTNFGGGRAQRPLGAFSSRSPVLRGTAMLGTAMQSYVLGTTFQIIRYLKNGFFRPAGLTPAERHAAMKAGVQMLATQLAAAGLLGLPFVSGVLSLLDKAFPELESNKNLREWVSSLAGDEVLTDMSMTGIPSMLGWDMQSRLTMGNTLPGVSEVNGFQPENLLGPPANLVTQFVFGAKRLASGDTGGGRAFVPSALKKTLDLVGGEGKLKDYRDREILSPTPGEKLGAYLGFNPKRLSDFNAARRMAELNETVENRREGEFRQQLAEEVLKGNFGSVQAALKAKVGTQADYNLEAAVRGIAQTAEELTFPRDLRREGSSPTRSRLLQLWNLDNSQPSEVQRLQFRKQIEARFGLTGVSSRAFQQAQLMDQLRQQNPHASRSELRRLAERSVRQRASAVQLE